MAGLNNLSIVDLAKLYRKKEVSPVDTIKESFGKIEQVEPKLNAFISLYEDEALNQARVLESKFLNDEPLHILAGIPYTLKDLFYIKGKVTTCGSRILKEFQPNYTSKVAKQLQSYEAILLGKTNMLEFAYGIVHPDYGQTNNPWDISKTSGGSSSGSAASIATGIGSFSIGTDTGGSIRIPASYCGVVGLKPTRGSVDMNGVFPLSWSLDHVGPITRTTLENKIVYRALTEEQNRRLVKLSEIESVENSLVKVGKHKPRVAVLSKDSLQFTEKSVKTTYFQMTEKLARMGWESIDIDFHSYKKANDILMKVLLPEAALIHEKWLDREEDYAEKTFEQLKMGQKELAIDYLKNASLLDDFTKEVSQTLENVDAILTPTVQFVAPSEDPEIGNEELDEMLFTGPFNVSGHPAVSMNIGFDQNNMPIGLQLVGKHYHDQELLSLAYWIEKEIEKRYPNLIGM